MRNVPVRKVRYERLCSEMSRCETTRSKTSGCETSWSEKSMCKPPGPKSLGPKRPGPNILDAKRPGPKSQGANLPRPKCPGVKRLRLKSQGVERLGPKRPVRNAQVRNVCIRNVLSGPTRPWLKYPGVKHAARFSHFVKLKPINYHFNVVEGKSGIRVTEAVDVVFWSTLRPHFVTQGAFCYPS